MKIDEIIEGFEFIDDWEERIRFLIELGRDLEPLPAEAHSPANKVNGCTSQVWLETSVGDGPDPVLSFRGDSDAHLVKGLVAITIALYSGRSARTILATDAGEVFDRIRLREHLTPQRSNGLRAMVERIKREAASAARGELSTAGEA
ncbi:SufE family protein [Hansschlegelia plantiphila]|uniref:Cysteine desulfurization protein SufE n=1 Tax=Hansschlegelia plantiphila TaxID=374655 RepID=A0A9W6IX68_9HYPH|nr:SufE family protein [Hansschlegelia plantiphila]GLK66692.1 cysteine desulfurization protein SufE [Hansschlegelia plantiphila]